MLFIFCRSLADSVWVSECYNILLSAGRTSRARTRFGTISGRELRVLPAAIGELAQSGFDCGVQRFTGMQRGQNGELFALEPAEIDVFVHAMHGQKDGAGFQLGHGADAFAFVALAESIAGDIEIVRIFAHFQQQIVNRITQIEQADVRLQAQTQLRGIRAREIFRLE